MMTVSWTGLCCSKPPAVAISLRKATQTYKNILANQAFTVNIASKQFAKEVDFIGMVSGRVVDKFKETGLSPLPSDHVKAPYVKEFPLALECKIIHTLEIGVHTQFIGEIVDVKADISVLTENEQIDMEQVDPFLFSAATQTYYSLGSFLGKSFSIGKKL